MSETTHYLQTCRDLHGRLTELKYKDEQDLPELEKRVKDIKSGCKLTEEHIENLKENAKCIHLDLEQFGSWPESDQLKSDLKGREFNFRRLHVPAIEKEVVEQLYDVFKQIEVVSVLLRFIKPECYGILSPPVEQILGIGPSYTHVEKYLSYVKNLRAVRGRVGLRTAAEADMALWVLSVGVVKKELDGIKEEPGSEIDYRSLRRSLQREHKKDLFLRTIFVENLTGQLFGKLTRRELAEALNECWGSDAKELAGQIAAIEFEKSVRKLSGIGPESKKSLWELVRVAGDKYSDVKNAAEKEKWGSRAVHTRNNLMHPDEDGIKRWRDADVSHLIKVMNSAFGLSERLPPQRRTRR